MSASRHERAVSAENVTARCAVCASPLSDLIRADARYCSGRCREQARRWRKKQEPDERPAWARSVDINPGCPPDDGSPGQARTLPVEVAQDVWDARGTRWALELAGETFVLQAEDTTILRPPWPMPKRAAARAWARMTLSTPAGGEG